MYPGGRFEKLQDPEPVLADEDCARPDWLDGPLRAEPDFFQAPSQVTPHHVLGGIAVEKEGQEQKS